VNSSEPEGPPRRSQPSDANAIWEDPALFSAIGHLYRADVDRGTAYRRRMDTTTGWAINVSLVVGTYTLANQQVSHVAFLVLMLADLGFLHVETRRFAAHSYSTVRRRLLLLERAFVAELATGSPPPDFRHTLVDALVRQRMVPNYAGLIGWRLRRGYLWIFGGVLAGWLSKLSYLSDNAIRSVNRAAVGSIPGWAVCLGVLAFYTGLVLLALAENHSHVTGDDGQRGDSDMLEVSRRQ
jgi:uncharacterized membrane protein